MEKGLIEYFNTSPLLVWHDKKETLSHFDFEVIQSKETKTYNGILFCFHTNKLEILFRPHYYFNQNKHNANDFTAMCCIKVLQDFIKTFGIYDFEKFKVVNLEYGLNIKSPIDVKDLVTFLYSHQRNEFKTDAGLSYSKKAYRSTHWGKENTYKIIKAYAKGLQFPEVAERDLFRFEVKSKKSRYIKKLGIYDLSDLLNPIIYETFASELIKEFAEVLILDNDGIFTNLNIKEKDKLEKYLNTNFWYKVLQDKQNRNKFSYHKKEYFRLLEKTENNIHTTLKNLIKKKLEILKISAVSPPPEKTKISAVSPPLRKKKISADSPINIMGNCTKNGFPVSRICPVTKMDISIQKENSFLLSNTGLKYLEKTNPEMFDFLKSKLVTGKPNKFEKNIYEKLSKQIRNKYFNNPTKYYNKQPQLF